MRAIVVPVKSLSRSKTRLSRSLSPLERGALTLAMFEDVLDATLQAPGWETWVISPDEVVLEIAARRGTRAIAEVKPGLAAAIRQTEVLAGQEQASALAVMPADLPLLSATALVDALHTLGPVVLVPSSRGGTSLLLRRPPRAIRARFGPDSFRKHLELAEARGIPVAIVERRELAFDLDEPSDILTLLRSSTRGRTREVCVEMDLAGRLAVNA